MSKVQGFTLRAKQMYEQAQSRGEEVYGIKPWYSSVSLIDNSADIAFIGANPGGGRVDQINDEKLGYLQLPYDEDLQYQAWLDDRHWGDKDLQMRAIEAFGILYGGRDKGKDALRNAASFNVVPMRSSGVDKLSRQTWNEGVKWCLDVLDCISPSVIVCLGNGKSPGRSAWSVVADKKYGFGRTEYEERPVNGTYNLKRGRASLKSKDVLVIGLPHLSYPVDMRKLRRAAKGWEIK